MKNHPALFIVFCILAVMVMASFAGCTESGNEVYLTLEDYNNAKLGTFPASPAEQIIQREFPDAETVYCNSLSDLILALKTNKIDGFVLDRIFYEAIARESTDLGYIDQPLAPMEYAFILPHNPVGDRLKAQMDTFLAALEESGELSALQEKWCFSDEPQEPVDLSGLSGENGSIHLAIGTDCKPMVFRKNNQYTGYEIELAAAFAKEYGYSLNITEATFDGILFGVETGKFDMGAFGLNPTPERAQAVQFSTPSVTGEMFLIVRANDDSHGIFSTGIKESFVKTFIREDRWMLIAEGIGTTLLISLLSAFFGTALGFLLFMASRSAKGMLRRFSSGLAGIYTRIIAGTPVVVILMILFYVVFGHYQNISGVFVAIIGFSLTFGSFVYSHMTVSVHSVDPGQTEAAYSLGYSRNRAFFHIVLPQAMTVFLPSYCGEFVALIKATAVVGYIAVNDLTRMGDIIRSNTYEAFFPLITTGIIYFVLTWIAASLLTLLKDRYDPKRRNDRQILKGLKPSSKETKGRNCL